MARAPLEAGSVVGRRYQLERELSRQGGMGVVWTARHLVTKRRVAIKLLRSGGQDDAASRARLVREARASCAVDHPSVLPVQDVIDADGAPALVMELLEGESLRERLERVGALGVRETCSLLAPVADALAAAHAARVVHRDIKPENIFLVGAVGGEVTVKVLDFGIAKIVATEEATTNLTESGAMLGTPYYMAPEQAFGERDVGPAADAWALGIVLYECLTGERPTQAENLGQVIKRITRDPIEPIEERVADVPPALAQLIGRLLQRDVESRELDMASVGKTLEAAAAEPAPAPPASVPATPRARTALLAIALLLLATALGWRALSSAAPAATAPSASASASATSPPSVTATTPATVTIPSAPTPTPTAPSTPHPTPSPSLAPSPSPAVSPSLSSSSSSPPPPPVPPADAAAPTGPGHVIITPPF